MKALVLENISFRYDKQEQNILSCVDLELEAGTVTAITGNSGCGKSTLAKIACGVIPKAIHGHLEGKVYLFGEDSADKEIYETAQQVSMVFQEPESQLFAPAVIDEIAFGPENLCFGMDEINARVNDALRTVGMGMEGFADRPPHKLSGGQQQLIALASILALQPKIIILDEVAAQVDEEGTVLLKKAVQALKAQGRTIMIIEHEPHFEEFYDRKYCLASGSLVEVAAR